MNSEISSDFVLEVQTSSPKTNRNFGSYARSLAMPTITYRPKDVAIDQHGEAIFICEAEGNPPPTIFWSLEGNRTLIFPGEKRGKFRAGANKEGQTVLTVQVSKICRIKRVKKKKKKKEGDRIFDASTE